MANANGERAVEKKFIYILRDHVAHQITDPDLVDLVLSKSAEYCIPPAVADLAIKLQEKLTQAETITANLTSREHQIMSLCGVLGLTAEEQLEPTVVRLAETEKRLRFDDMFSSRGLLLKALCRFRADECVALRRFLSGEKATASTDIVGGLTLGYGVLSDNGYWQYPLPQIFITASERAIKHLKRADTLEDTMRVVLSWLKNDAATHDPKKTGYAARVQIVSDVLAAIEQLR